MGLYLGRDLIAMGGSEVSKYRNLGEIIPSVLPLSDAGLHLLDGSVIDGNGAYADFVSFIANLKQTNPDLFVSESTWQDTVATYGVCGKFTYDATLNRTRLPKITGIIEGTTDVASLGNLVEAGLPDHQHALGISTRTVQTGTNFVNAKQPGGDDMSGWASVNNSIYGKSNTVQPQTIKCFYYIVVATTIKTGVIVNLDNVATDLNLKAGTDLANLSTSGKIVGSGLGMPSNVHTSLSIGASGSTYTAPSNGYFYVGWTPTGIGGWVVIYNTRSGMDQNAIIRSPGSGSAWWTRSIAKCFKGDVVNISYADCSIDFFSFVYAEGSKSEAN